MAKSKAVKTDKKAKAKKKTVKKVTKKDAKPKNKKGRPNKFDSIDMEQVKKLAAMGLTDQEICNFIGICRATFANYKVKYKDFLDTINKAKETADLNVTKSLYKTACAGDVRAQRFWLNNRRPDRWRDKKEIDHTTKGEKITGPSQEDKNNIDSIIGTLEDI